MSTNYYAALIVGVKVDKSKVFVDTRIRGCKHPIHGICPGNFCNQCGNQIWINGTTIIPEYEDEDEITLVGVQVFSNDEDTMIVGERSITVGFYTDQGTSGMMPQGAYSDLYKERLREKLEPLGLWDQEKFGTWIIMWAS